MLIKRITSPRARYTPNGMIANRSQNEGQIDYNFYRGGQTTGIPGFNQRQTKASRTFGNIAKELGLKAVDSVNDIAAMYDYLGRANNRGSQASGGGSQNPGNVQGTNDVTVNNPATVTTTPEIPDPITTYQPGEYSPYSGMNTGVISGLYNRPQNIGMGDVYAATLSGFTINDIANEINSGRYKVGNPARQAVNAARSGVTSMFYSPQFVDWRNPSSVAQGQSGFGHADLAGNRAAGYSYTDILSYLDSNPGKLNANQRPGIQGGLYEQIKAGAEGEMVTEYPEPELPKTLMVGSTGLGNSGAAEGVRPKRSENSRSGRSSLGTSQYNRSNFGTRRSPLAIGLNV